MHKPQAKSRMTSDLFASSIIFLSRMMASHPTWRPPAGRLFLQHWASFWALPSRRTRVKKTLLALPHRKFLSNNWLPVSLFQWHKTLMKTNFRAAFHEVMAIGFLPIWSPKRKVTPLRFSRGAPSPTRSLPKPLAVTCSRISQIWSTACKKVLSGIRPS